MKLVTSVICEDIRIEKSGRYTLVGANSGTFKTPTQIKLGSSSFAIWAIFEVDDQKSKKREVSVKFDCALHGKTHFKHDNIPLLRDPAGKHLFFSLKLPFVPAFHEGEFEMLWSEDKEKWNTLIKTFNTPNESLKKSGKV